jgi:phospholipid/cholesterol/gamma-HCH transport system substrate-binding protein
MKNIRLGLFVLLGTVFVIIGIYLIGDKQNLFGSTIQITARFHNVNGLMSGNNIRFGGVDVGTVKSVEIIDDTSVQVVMILKEESQGFIKNNAIVSIGTDGLMGNKIVNIQPMSGPSDFIKEGDVLGSKQPLETDQMIRTLNQTNEEVYEIAKNLKSMSDKLNDPNSLWNLILDTVLAENVKQAVVNLKVTSIRTATVTGDLSRIVQNIKSGKGAVGALITDTSFATALHQSVVNIKIISDTLAYISGDLREVSSKIKNGEGTIGAILMDTTFVHDLNESMKSIKSGAAGFDDNMEALKHNFLLRKYFRKKSKPE